MIKLEEVISILQLNLEEKQEIEELLNILRQEI
jgi:hypothetical protein